MCIFDNYSHEYKTRRILDLAIILLGEVVTCPSFYQIDVDGASGSELPTLIMAIPLMVKHATEGYAMDEEEVEDYE